MSKAIMAECMAEALELFLESKTLDSENEPKPGELIAVATLAVALYQERMSHVAYNSDGSKFRPHVYEMPPFATRLDYEKGL